MEPLSPLPELQLNWSIIMQVGLYFCLVTFGIYSFILYYHWQSYSMEAKATIVTYLIYLGITIPLLVTMALIAFF